MDSYTIECMNLSTYCIPPLEGMVVWYILQDVVYMFHYQHILHYQYHMMVHNMADQLAYILYTDVLLDSDNLYKLLYQNIYTLIFHIDNDCIFKVLVF